MTIFTTITDIRNHVDGMIGDTTPEQNEALVTYIRNRGYEAGLSYGDDWGDFLESLDINDLCSVALGVQNDASK